MTNHVHLLVTPQYDDSISRLMQHVGRHYVQYVNRTYRRSGTLWEGRHKGSLVDAENYLLTCYRYIELNPVSACMVERPEEYPWSSFRCNALGEPNGLITPHPVYTALSANEADRHRRYRDLFRFSLPEKTRSDVAKCLSANHILGNVQFREDVEATLGRKVGKVERGRPAKSATLVN